MTTVDWRDGWLCIRDSQTDFSQPLRHTSWWPVRECLREEVGRTIGLEARRESSGDYSVEIPGNYAVWRIRLSLRDGGATKSLATTTEEIPPPKVRAGMQVRWNDGRWEKYLKTQGWVAA